MRRRCLTTAVAARRKMKIMKPFLDVLGLISASLLVRSHYRKMPILACLKSKNRSKSPFSIGLVFSIVSESTVLPWSPSESQSELVDRFLIKISNAILIKPVLSPKRSPFCAAFWRQSYSCLRVLEYAQILNC